MRTMMTKEVTKTTVKIAKIEKVEGVPVATTLDDKVLLGNVTLEKAQKLVTKECGAGVQVFEVIPSTEVYTMAVEEFIKLATVKVDAPEVTENVTEGHA